MKGIRKKYPDPYKRSGRKFYYFAYTHPKTGKRHSGSTGCTTKRDAQNAIIKFIDSLDEQLTSVAKQSFADYSQDFFVDGKCPRQARLTEEGLPFGETHMYNMRNALDQVVGRPGNGRKRAFKRLAFADLLLEAISHDDVYKLRSHLSKQPGGRMGQQIFKAVKTVLSEAEERQHIRESLVRNIQPQKLKPTEESAGRRDALTKAELQSLWRNKEVLTTTVQSGKGFSGGDPRHVAAIVIITFLGLRVGELLALRWKNVDLTKNRFSITEAVKGHLKDAPIGEPKWGKRRTDLVLPKKVASELIEYKKTLTKKHPDLTGDESFVIPQFNGKHVTHAFVRYTWKRLREKGSSLGGDDKIDFSDGRSLPPHSARHTLTSCLVEHGCDFIRIQRFMGWEADLDNRASAMLKNYGNLQKLDTTKIAEAIDDLIG